MLYIPARVRQSLVKTPRRLRAAPFLSEKRLRALVGAVRHMHEKLQLVHRDIEPRHVGFTAADDDPHLIDLGSAISLKKRAFKESDPFYAGEIVLL